MDRIERLRHQDLADLVDRAIAQIGAGTPRQLVQVYNGGSMPSESDHFYLTNPVYLNGAETEGGTATYVADTTQTIVVDVLHQAPAAGDILTAYAVGGRWVAELTSSQQGTGCIQFLGCNNHPLQGVTVRIYNQEGGTLLGTYTSNAQGKVCPGLDAGFYWMDTTQTTEEGFPLNRYVWIAEKFGIPAQGVLLWPVNIVSGYGCCSGTTFPLPTTLFLTVCGQTFTLVAVGPGPTTITGWEPDGAIAPITTPNVAGGNVGACNTWDGVTTVTETVPWAVRLSCPEGTTTMNGACGVCGIGHYNPRIGSFDTYAICPPSCEGVGFGTCCNGSDQPGPGTPFTLTGTIGETVSLTGTMPGSMSPSCVLPPAGPWPLPCTGEGITVTD
jgi:hypothetical protein